MKMSVLKELEISLFKPHLYYKLKNLSLIRILSFNFINALMALIFSMMSIFFIALFTKKMLGFSRYLATFTLQNSIVTFLYMVFGLFLSSLVITGLCLAINHIKKIKSVDYVYLFNYATHSLSICALLNNFVGPFVIVFALAYCFMGLSRSSDVVADIHIMDKNNKWKRKGIK